jgi:DNA-binding beta-propeller fold protein YncE
MGKWQRKPPGNEPVIPEQQVKQIEQQIAREEAGLAREEAVLAEEIREIAQAAPVIPQIPPLPVSPGVIPPPDERQCLAVSTHIYALTADENVLFIIDPETGMTTATVQIGDDHNGGAYMTYDPVHRNIYMVGPKIVSTGPDSVSDAVYVFDDDIGEVVLTIITPSWPFFTGVDPVHNLLYVPHINIDDTTSGAVSVFDATTGAFIATIASAWLHSYFIMVDPATGTAYIMANDDIDAAVELWRVDGPTGTPALLTTLPTVLNFPLMDWQTGNLYISGSNKVFAYNIYDDTVTEYPVGLSYSSITLDPNTGVLYLLGNDEIHLLDPRTANTAILTTLPSGEYYTSTFNAYVMDGDVLYAATRFGIYGYNIDTGQQVFAATPDYDPDETWIASLIVGASCILWDK